MKLALFVAEHTRGCEDEYARLLAETLAVPVVPLGGSTPLPDEASYAAARAAWEGLERDDRRRNRRRSESRDKTKGESGIGERDRSHPALEADARPLIAESVLAAFAPFASELAARNAVVLVHQPLALMPERREAEREQLAAIERQVLGLVPRVIASSEAVADAIVTGAAVPRARIAVVAPPTPEFPRAHGSAGPGVAILGKGALAPESAHEVLLAALAGLPDLDWRLSVAGCVADPDYAAELARLAGQLGIASRVRFAQDVAAAEMEMLWQEADVFALAAAGPGYRMATAAALKRGLPVVICGDAATVPAIPAEAGAIAPPGDRAQLAKALRRLVFDGVLRREMADAAWEAGKTLPDPRASARRFVDALENVQPA